MNEVAGLVYLLNQAGVALAQANARVRELEQQLSATEERPGK